MGEITSPLQNVWFWLKYFRYTNSAADEAFAYVSWIYSAFYIFIRSFFGVAVVRTNAFCTRSGSATISVSVADLIAQLCMKNASFHAEHTSLTPVVALHD